MASNMEDRDEEPENEDEAIEISEEESEDNEKEEISKNFGECFRGEDKDDD